MTSLFLSILRSQRKTDQAKMADNLSSPSKEERYEDKLPFSSIGASNFNELLSSEFVLVHFEIFSCL